MSTPNDGGPAFPQHETMAGNTVADEHGQGGMSLRAWLAGQALVGCATGYAGYTVEGAADRAVKLADATLERLQITPIAKPTGEGKSL